jgi:hypothetical protein
MKAQKKPMPQPISDGKPIPAALFKTSLRDWQAAYQARRAVQTQSSEKASGQTATA